MRNLTIALVSLCVPPLLSACGDTCNAQSTFQSIEPGSVSSEATSWTASLSFTTDAGLPSTYFSETATLDHGSTDPSTATPDSAAQPWENDYASVVGFQFAQGQLQLELSKADYPPQSSRSVALHFIFGDRQKYAGCSHVGGPDEYRLNLRFLLVADSDTAAIESLAWDQAFRPGAI